MPEKIYITSQQTATFICPNCSRSKTVDVSKYATLDKVVRVKVKCPCGHAYTAILEKRKQYRRETNLPGTYIQLLEGKPVAKGLLTVKDISATGLKLRLNSPQNLAIGDPLQIEFHLDDRNRTLIQKLVVVRNKYGPFVGVEFGPTEALDQALGFYLFS
jgi:hypothetical protein